MLETIKRYIGWGFSFSLGKKWALYLGLMNIHGSKWCFDFAKLDSWVSTSGDHSPEMMFSVTVLGIEILQLDVYSTRHDQSIAAELARFDCPTCEELEQRKK